MKEVNFGFKKVFKDQKESLVAGVFSNVAKKYDLMNDLMSGGLHRLWKSKMIQELNFNPFDEYKIIDVAGGTGDISFLIHDKLSKIGNNCTTIDIVDINPEMLEVGKERAIENGLFSDLNFVEASGEKLPYADNSFDFYTIAFGIRNFTDISLGLSEAFRVLKDGGKFVCLEFSKIDNYILSKIHNFHCFSVVPKIGEVILKDRDSYQYLAESIAKFPNQNQFKSMMDDAGFSDTKYQNLTFGTVAIHRGVVNKKH
jgi:demethylmenaquinone methyltransferase/2-methoxy-6-polyprenyl-1,4-benzoquinol methylase